MTKKATDRIFSVFLMTLAVGIYWQTLDLPESKVGLLTGPAFYPQWVSALLFLCSSITLVKTVIRPSAGAEDMVLPPPRKILKLFLFLVVIGAVLLLIPYAGWLGALIVLVFVIEAIFEGRKWYHAMGIAAVMSIAIFLIFELGLGIRLPRPFE
jgi:hypothetical protein